MAEALFRAEALAAQRASWLGEISLAQPPGVRVLAAFALLAAAAVLVFLASASFARRSHVAGRLVPDAGLVTVVAPAAGTLARSPPAQGTHVGSGDGLLVISAARASPGSGDTTAARLARIAERRAALSDRYAAALRLLDAQERGAADQLAALRRERAQLASSLALERRRLQIAERLGSRLRDLAAQQFVSELELARQQEAALAQAATLAGLERSATALDREILALEQGSRELALEAEVRASEHAAELARLEEERIAIEAAGEVLVASPVDGVVVSAIAQAGQAVAAGQPLLSVLPDGSTLQAELFVPSMAVGFVAAGDRVLLRYPAFPHEKFGPRYGTVVNVSESALEPVALAALTGGAVAGGPAGAPYRVTVALDEQFVLAYGEQHALLPGMRVEADLVGERRKLYEWLLEPLYSVTGRL
ncbi:MAG TPA: HlyD family efflux transporter periplasmic adaptor subunit [Woeseiaceae bacterium]